MNDSFEQFWDKLVEHEVWYDQMKMRFFRKDMKEAAKDTYIFLLASENRWACQDYQDFRKCYHNFLKNAKDKPQGPVLQQEEKKEEVKQSEPILTGEARKAKIKEWLETIKTMPAMTSSVPKLSYQEIADEGDWLPKKPAPYPSTSESEVRKQLLHIEYLKQNYDPRTQEKLPNWIPENEWLEQLNK
jgi:hypothetical protein